MAEISSRYIKHPFRSAFDIIIAGQPSAKNSFSNSQLASILACKALSRPDTPAFPPDLLEPSAGAFPFLPPLSVMCLSSWPDQGSCAIPERKEEQRGACRSTVTLTGLSLAI